VTAYSLNGGTGSVGYNTTTPGFPVLQTTSRTFFRLPELKNGRKYDLRKLVFNPGANNDQVNLIAVR